jgi:glutathione synthase/RimK-type ligase-like ATP-grasp enzyme
MILIASERDDAHATRLLPILRSRGADALLFPTSEFPTAITIAARPDEERGLLKIDGRRVGLGDVGAVWYRRPQRARPSARLPSQEARDCAALQSELLLIDLWNDLGCPMLPAPPEVARRAGYKLSQLRLARQLGFTCAPTLVTNDRDEALEFYRANDGRVITKPLSPFFDRNGDVKIMRWTEPVTRRDIAHARSLQYAPIIMQAEVQKRIELRVNVVGDRVFTAAIGSQENRRTSGDWRRYAPSTRHWQYKLPADMERACVNFVARLGLAFGALDFIVTPEDALVFLELNPNGQWYWIEDLTGLPIADAVCGWLMAKDAR